MFNCDFFTFGVQAMYLLLFSGDMAAARAGAAKAVDAQKKMLVRVDSKEAARGSHSALVSYASNAQCTH